MDCKDLIETYEKKRKEKTDKKKEADKRKSGAGGILFCVPNWYLRFQEIHSIELQWLFINIFFVKKVKHKIRNLEESSGISSLSSDKKKEADKRKSGPGGIKHYPFYFVPLIFTNKNSRAII